jgi:hypothetical protein
VLPEDVHNGEIIETLLTTQPLEMVPMFRVSIPDIVLLTAAPIFFSALDYYFLKIFDENPSDNPFGMFPASLVLRNIDRSHKFTFANPHQSSVFQFHW